jgi:hypothetical protein
MKKIAQNNCKYSSKAIAASKFVRINSLQSFNSFRKNTTTSA